MNREKGKERVRRGSKESRADDAAAAVHLSHVPNAVDGCDQGGHVAAAFIADGGQAGLHGDEVCGRAVVSGLPLMT